MGHRKGSRSTRTGTGILDVRINCHESLVAFKLVICIILAASGVVSVSFDDSIVTSIDLGEDSQPKSEAYVCPPNSNSWVCNDKLKCIPKSSVCDQTPDCYDISDEENCPQLPCRNGTFECKASKKCIPNGWLCDGSNDCGLMEGTFELDMSDEQDPGCKAEHHCEPNNFKCSDGKCIKTSELCDTVHNCPSSEDEHKFCGNANICKEAVCKYGCRPSPTGEAICYCSSGQEFDGKDCVESNECSVAGACDQICKLNGKRKVCDCLQGYKLEKGSYCKAANDQGEPLLLYQDASDIKWLNLNGSNVTSHSSYQSPSHVGLLGMDFDHLNHTVCWISHENRSHSMLCALSSNLNTFWQKPKPYLYSFEDVYQINFDWISTNYYFVDENHEMIFLCQENLSICKTIIDTDISKPRGMALDPTEGFIFFTVWGTSGPKLERALMDGSSRTNLVTKQIVYPYGITADLPLKNIYWVDKFLDSIERIDYDGKNRRTIHRGIQLLQDITVFENNLYMTSMHEDSIIVLNKFNLTSNYTTLKSQLKKPFAIRVYHRARQPIGKHPCHSHAHCSEFCFPLWKDGKPVTKCGCREGYAIGTDGSSCKAEEKSNFIIYTKSKTGLIRSVSLNPQLDEKRDIMIPVVQKQTHSALGFDSRDSTLYYSDTSNLRIMQKKLDEVDSKVFLDQDIGQVESISVDYIGRNLYWIDETLKAIYVANLKSPTTTKSLLVHSNLTQPRSIVVYPIAGLLFWSNWASMNEKDGSIEQAWMDGTHRTILVQNLGWPIGLTVDSENRYLYWLDALQFTIQRVKIGLDDTQTPKKEILLKSNMSTMGGPSDFTYFNGALYVALHGKLLKANVSLRGGNESELHGKLQSFLKNEDDIDISRLLVFEPSLQRGKNKCSSSPGCQHMCAATPGKPGFTCLCKEGYSLTKDGKTCETIPNYKSPLSCNVGEFQCKKIQFQCIAERLLCNNINDCEDGSDEDMSICDKGSEGLCGQHSFHCGSGSAICVPLRHLCDGKSDCPNGSDEKMDRCTNSTTITCSEFEFKCAGSNPRCIPRSWVCDGERDCGSNDDSDEHSGCVYPECSVLEFSCPKKNSRSVCISLDAICDGIDNCPGKEDESHCEINCNGTGKAHCEPEDMASYPMAIDNFACDFDVGFFLSKEECYNVTCGRHSFHCHKDQNQCVPLWARCDGHKQCADESDELNCPKPVPHCPFPSRLCDNNTRCIEKHLLCNLRFDCQDKSDEGSKCTNGCEAANCSHNCTNSPEGPLCYCPADMHVSLQDKSQCVAEHPCDRFGTCSQICRKIGTKQHQCYCLPGFSLRDDGVTCSSVSTESPYLVFSNRHELRGLYLNNTANFQSLISNLRNSIALDFLYDAQTGTYHVFWSDVVDDRIYKGSLVGGSLINIEIVIETGLATAEGLAVDWIGENIYWVESNLDQIEVAKLNGSFRETLISGDMVSPRSISVDPNVGLLFWSDWQTEAPRIERASMSGKYRTIVFKVGTAGDGAWPNGITLDFDLQRVYWVDARLDSIHTIKYDGTDFQTVLSNHEALSHPFSITLFESTLVWTDWRSNSVMKANKFHGGQVSTIHKTYTQPFDVKILHQTRQPIRISNPCGKNNGNCSHLCLLSVNSTHDCGCPHLMTLGPDNRVCIANEKMLLFSRLNEIRAVYLDKPYYHAAPPISYPLIVAPANLHFVAKYKQVYWSDSQSGETKRANIETHPSIETLIDSAAGKPLAIGVDWISNLIFIALQNPSRNSISVTNLDGQYFTTIIYGKQKQELKNVNSIAVNPYKAELYWPDGNTPNDYTIQMASMDGSKRTVLTKSRDNQLLQNPASLSYDFKSDRLYWINFNTERIQYYDFKAKTVKLLSFGDLKPHVITVYQNELYFASEKENAILKGDKTLGGKYTFLRNNTENIYSIRVYDPEDQKGDNPCAENKRDCEHLCLPVSAKKRVCKCALGYISDDKNPTQCKSVDTVIIYSDSSGIKGMSPQSGELDDLLVPISGVTFATDIDVDEGSHQLYWLDNEKGRISRIKRDGTGKETVLKDLEAVTGLAIDWNAGNMYWANPKDSYIEVAHLNGTSHYVLVRKELEKPMSLAVDPSRGLLFWTDVIKGRVERAALDGSNRLVIASNERASDIALDIENERVYWCDSTYDKIESIKYDGSDRKTVYTGTPGSSHLHSPVVDKGYLYWVDMGHSGGSIMRAPVKNFSLVHAVREDLGVTIKDLTVFSSGRQTGKNPCGINNGGCGDLCFWNGTVSICICAHGKLASDNKSCEPYDAFIAYSRVNAIETVHVKDEVTPNYPYPPIQSADHIRNAIGLAYDYKKFTLFYSDVQLGTINSVFFNGTKFAVVAEKQGSVEGLYYEASHSDLYWTCSNDASINRINPYLPSSKVEKIIKLASNDKPRGISVDPCDSRVYWTNWDSNRPSIQRAYLSGYRIESIIITDIRMPNSLALDHGARKLYWVDARLDKIERAELDGTNRKIIARDKPKHAFSISIYKDYIIWSDWVLLSIMRANKYTGEDVQALRKDIAKPMGLVAVAPQEDVCLLNPCKFLNGGCTDTCSLDEYGKAVCRCSPGKALLGDRCVAEVQGMKNCTSLEFACESGGCILYSLSCDGIPHCPDSSDEDVRYCATRQCKAGFFKCVSNRLCLPESERCNSNICPGNDAANCVCSDKEFRCHNGLCIPIEKRCNQNPDCTDVSDELRSECPEVTCPKIQSLADGGNFYQCKNTTACLSPKWECDGQQDCFQGEDEIGCPSINCENGDGENCVKQHIPGRRNQSEECQPNSFRCSDGQCILSAWRCDGDSDCDKNEDEMNCEKQTSCGRQQFRCGGDDGQCIAEHWKCDGIKDCDDESDEPPECVIADCDLESQFKCSTGHCIPIHFVCDGEEDCRKGEDEDASRGCGNRTLNGGQGCSLTEFACRNGLCLPRNYVCDMDRDCAEGEDELGCYTPTCENGDSQNFKCKNGQGCIPAAKKCNGFADCNDNSDEDSFLCQEKYCGHLCKNGVCVNNETLVCNGEDNCGDSTDEIGCGIDECQIEAKLCDHKCIDKKVGYECQCFVGYKPSVDNPSVCEDQNECNERACSQLCKNSIGSYRCSCLPGYILKEDQHTCKANSSEPLKIIFTNQYYIRMVDGSGDVTLLAHNLTNAVALDYHWDAGCIYWSDVTAIGSSIKRLCSGTNNSKDIGNDVDMVEQTLHHFTVQSPDGLAIDWVAQNLYWCDKGTNTIEVSKVDGRFRKVLIEDLQDPRAIALDPFRGYLYWSDWGDEPIIGKAGMDGTRVQTLITENLGWPNALTISYETKEIWWADAKEDYIAVADLNGKNRHIVHSRINNPTANIHHIFSLTVFESWIYWSDWETKTVERCHKYSGLNQTTVSKLIHRPMDVKVFHPFRQPPMESNPCINNGGCQNLCLLTPEGGQVCACPENFILGDDGKSCKSNCTSSHFVCEKTSKCIPKWWKCDTQKDCEDGEDEPASCPPFNCTPGYVQFDDIGDGPIGGGGDGKMAHCLHPSVLCDGKNDTKNARDEEACEEHTCFSSQFKCQGNGTVQSMCIPSHKRCDSTIDCPLEQDEKDCVPAKCPQYQCASSGKCLQLEWVCDLENDCPNGEDETNCTTRVCNERQFRCRSGKCLPESWKCDGERDCSEGEDELAERCDKPPKCDDTYFACANSHKCIPSRWRCDFDRDCPEGDDELGCTPRNCSESEIKCGDGRCLHYRLRCNGNFDCDDHSDEWNCNTSCSGSEFQCGGLHSSFCVPGSFRCDSEVDCLDGSDEIGCGDNSTCDGFLCTSGECIRNSWVCDGERDCSEGEDENSDVCASRRCESNQFRCRNNKCIAYTSTCNSIDDCKDGSDELPGMCITHRPRSCNSGEFECTSSKKCINESLVCDGFAECSDESDEIGCQICPFAYCSQLCVVKKQVRGSKTTHFSCECAEGYSLSHEGNASQCVAKGEAPYLVVATEDQLRKIRKPHDNETLNLLLTTPSTASKIDSIDYTMEDDGSVRLFWTSRTSKTIQTIYLPIESNSLHSRQKRSMAPVDIITGLDEPRGISIDWTTQKMYWVDAKLKTLSVSSLDGKTRMVLINKHISEPHDVVVDPQTGRVYWSDWLDQRIDFASMDGTGRKTVVNSPCPTGLTIDYPARRLYFTDIKSHTIESTTLEGKDRHVVKRFVAGEFKPYKIDVFEDTLFFTTYNSNKILKLNKFGKGNVTDITQGIHKASDVIVLQKNKQPQYDNPCQEINCPAPGLCVRNGSSSAVCMEKVFSGLQLAL